MSAIERCRTAALGGHVARCENENCGYTRIAYNSCRNRHCNKCQAAAAKQWLAERQAELLPVPYFHVVFTLPTAIADLAYQNKAVIYDLLFKASSETVLAIAADPKRLGARIGITAVLHTWSSTYDRARWRHLARRLTLGVAPTPLLSVGPGILRVVPRPDACEAPRSASGRPAAVLQPVCPSRRTQGVRALPRATTQAQMVCLRKAPVRRTRGGTCLSVA